jgi:hypothetical protein
MSELDQLLKQDPDFLPINDWKKDNDTGDEIKNRKNYADYVRGEYVSAGAYSDRIENEIRQSTYTSAVADGVIKPDDREAETMLFTPEEPDLDSKLQIIQTNLDTTDPAWNSATKYLTFKKLNPEGTELPEDIRAKGEQYFADAQSIADTGYRKAVKSAVRSGELPLAKVKNDKGEYEILVSPTAGAMNMAEAIRASKKGGVTFADASAVQSKLSTPIGFNEPVYKVERYSQAASMIEEYAKKDSHTSKIIQNYSEELAAADKDGRAPKSFDEYASSIRFQLNKSGLLPEDDALSNEEVSKALTQIAYNNANAGGKFKLYDKPEEAYKNVRNVGFGTAFVHPAAMVNDSLFAQSITDNPNLSADQKKILEARREPALQQQFDQYNELLSKSSKSDEWLNALQSGRVAGKKETDIVKEFVSNPDNFSEIQDRLAGIGSSIVDGVGEMAAAIPMMMGAEWARDYMVGNIKERSNRREVARLFGAEYGVGQDIAESLAPMLADVAATGLLAAATAPAAGAGGAVFLAAKQGARLTAKGLLKGMTSSALRQLPTETAEGAAERLVAQGLIKSSTTEAGISGAQAAIKGFNSELAKTIGITTATAIPAFNRSAGATYASVYSTLENNKDLTPEQKHDRALGAGLAAGATTALITGAFGAFGRGGLEDALLSGASRKQIKNVVARLSNVDDISDDVFNKVISKQVSETLKKYGTFGVAKETGKEIFKNSVDEGAEEGLDEFVNGFITDAATDQDTPFLEKLEQAARAALIGGVIGGGVPTVKAIKGAVMERPDIGVQIGVETEFARGVSDKLTESGSPLTAQTVYSILTAPRRTRAPIAQTILDASRQQVTPAESVAEVEDASVPTESPTAEKITEALNNAASPDAVAKTIVDERGQSQFAFVEDIPVNEVAKRGRAVRKPAGPASPVAQQLEFDFTSKQDKKPQDQLDLGLDVSDPEKPKVTKTRTASATKSIKKAKLAEQLNLDFDSVSVDEQNNHIDPNYSDEDLTTDERIRMTIELFGAIESGQLEAPAPKGKKAVKGVSAQATAAPAEPAAKLPKATKAPVIPAVPVADEPMFSPDEFIDDELIGQEVGAMTKIASLGYPVRLERKALHGMPQRGKYPKGYLAGKSDMVARKVNELFPVKMPEAVIAVDEITGKDKVSFYDPKAKKVVRKAPKAFVDENGVGIFNNDPVSMKLLLDRRIPVVVPADFDATINPSFRMYTSGGTRFLNDIVMTNPETGTGFTSALTKQDKVISSEPNYQYYENLSAFTSLFNPEITARSVPDPKGKGAEVTLDSIILDADQLYTTASTDRPTSAYGDPDKARATLRAILKPKQGTLAPEFFEAAVPAFNMSVRKEAFLYELRLGMDKFSERKSGEATPSLKTGSIKAAVEDFVSRTKVDKVTAAQNLAKVFGSEINPDAQPDLVIQKFIEDTVLTRRPNMPTYREIGAKVGNAFAEQQRTRDLFARKALFETTDPTDLAQIQDDTELFDPETEAADNTFITPTTPFEAPDSGLMAKALQEASFDAADALDTDPEMRAAFDKLLRKTVFKGNSAIDVTKFSSTDAFGMMASWMASGNYNTNPDAIKFQRDLRDGVYENGDRIRRPMKLMYLSSKTIEGDPTKDDAYIDSIRENLANSFGRPVSKQEASDFIKSIGGAVQKLWSRSYVRGEQIAYARQQNDVGVARLGLKTNDPESVIGALKTIASTEADANKRLLAKLLLENQGYIRQVEFSLDESPLEYSGGFIKASNGQPMISINLDGHNGRGLADVLLHEYTHAFVSISASSPNENLNAAQRGSLQRLNGILELARRSAADNGITDPVLLDGLENINEFVAHFFTSTDFQGFLKALLPPTKQRGFFARMVDAVLDMFGLNRSKQSNYQKAFTDLVDLTRAAVIRTPLTPKGLINRIAGPASRTLNQVSEAARVINDTLRPTAVETEVAAVEADVAIDQETEDLVSGITAQDMVAASTATREQTLAKVKDMIRMVRRMVPAEFVLQIRTDIPYAAAFQGGKILLNPNAMSGVVAGLDDVSARGIVEGIMTEEAAHAASYNALTQQELDNYVATLKESDFDDVIDRYYQTDELKVAAKARIRSEDPTTAAREREGMAEELLRMHSQKVTRGFTTEEDYMFFRSKPSLLKIIGRYMKGFINRYMAGKSVATMNGTQRATLQRMITEVRAINAGYRLTPNTLEFDAQNPHASLSQIATQLLGTQVVTEGVKLAQPLVQKTNEFNKTFLSDFWPKILKQVGGLSGRTTKGIRQAAEFAFSEVEPWVRENPKFIDYYESDWNTTKEYLEEAFPSVKEKPELFKFFRLISGLCSPSTKLSDNMVDAVNALDLWIREKNFDSINLEISSKGNMKLGKTPFTFRSTTGALKGRALKIVGELIKQQGSIDSVVDYLKEPVDYKTLQEFNKSVGYKGSVGGIGSIRNVVREATGQDTLIPRMFVFGQKVGAYTLNAVGDSRYTTTDIWEGRMIRSYFKNGFKTGTGLPENVDDQALMQLFATEFNSVWEQRTGVKMEPSALQAVRWFFIIDRLNSAGYIYAKTNETISGYTRSALKQRGFTSSVAGGRGTGVPTDAQETTATTAGQSTRVVYERNVGSDPDAGRRFVEGIRRTATEHPMGAAVEVKPDEFYNDPNNRLFLTEDGLAGVAVTSYGDLVSVFKHPTSKAKITEILDEAAQYAVTLDAFDVNGFLPNLYSRNGFRPVARVPFNKDYAPDGWPFELAGEPDVVLMVKDTNGDSGLPEIRSEGYAAIRNSVPVTDDYDAAVAMQTAAKDKVAKAKAAKELTSFPLATQFGTASQLPTGFNADTIDYSNFLESLEIPMMEVGTYQSPKGMLDKLLKGELDPRILRLKNQRDFFNKATFDLVKRYKTKLDAIIKKDFGDIDNAPVALIQDAIGSTKGLALPEDVLTQIEDDFNYDLDVIDTDDSLTTDEKVEARGIALMNRNKAVVDAEKALADSIRTRRDDALGQLAALSPELVQHIVQLRTLTDEMSKKVTSLYGFPPELKTKFDNQLGIYLTRTYKMFDEIGFGEKVLNDPDYETVRNAAVNFFEKRFIDSEVSRRISGANSVPRAQAEAEAKRELGLKTMGGRTYGQLMVEEFVNSYDKTGKAISTTNMSRQLKPLLDNVQLKRDLPEEIRNLLGEKGAETGVDNLLRSLVTTATMASNQSFLNHVRDIGRASGWLITATELKDGRAKDYDTFRSYKPIRESTASSYDPLGELYGPPEMVDAFRKVFSPDGIRFNQTAAQEVVNKTIGVAARLSGGAMAAKTLGSIGFYIRNIVSNALFFAPAQGFVNFKSMATKAYDEVWSNAIVDPARIDSYRTKLISLGVIGDDINTNIMTAMLRGGNSVDDVETKLGELIDTANKGTKPLRWLAERAQVLSGSVDAFYKIAYYENELRVLKQARSVDTGTLASASDAQLERMAADKVLATAQSSSQAPPIVQEVTKSGIGLLFAPFLRFKVEVPRIVINTYKTALTEMKSSNPVLKQRGITRFAGMTTMLSGVSAIVPAVASALAGIGDDEDEALRSSVPEYLRNHTFFYRRKADGQLQSWDFTFLNPFSIIADPTLRSMEQLIRGNPAKAAAKFVEVAIFDQYLDDQILSSAVQSLRDNENPSTKKPIYEEKLDNAGIVLLKSLGFLFKEAYQPSVMKRAIESYQAVGADYTEFDDSPAGILMREFYPVKRHDIELDKQLRNYLADTRDVFNRISERKNALFSKKAMEVDDVKDIIQSEIEDKAKINEDVYKKLRGFEGLGLKPQQLYQITTGMGYGKDRTRLLFNKIMDRPVLSPEYIKRLSDPENEQGAERLKAALEVLQGTPRYIMLEP